MGHDVSGVDIRERPVLDRLRAAGVTVHIGHNRSHVLGCDAVTASSAIADDLNELDEARKLGIPELSRAGMLASICARARSLAVAGTHGKTTTTSMLMLILAEAGWRPSFVIGGDVQRHGHRRAVDRRRVVRRRGRRERRHPPRAARCTARS